MTQIDRLIFYPEFIYMSFVIIYRKLLRTIIRFKSKKSS